MTKYVVITTSSIKLVDEYLQDKKEYYNIIWPEIRYNRTLC